MSRNLLEYPVTRKEVLDTIRLACDRAFDPRCIGGQERYIMNVVANVMATAFRHEDFNPTKEPDGQETD